MRCVNYQNRGDLLMVWNTLMLTASSAKVISSSLVPRNDWSFFGCTRRRIFLDHSWLLQLVHTFHWSRQLFLLHGIKMSILSEVWSLIKNEFWMDSNTKMTLREKTIPDLNKNLSNEHSWIYKMRHDCIMPSCQTMKTWPFQFEHVSSCYAFIQSKSIVRGCRSL